MGGDLRAVTRESGIFDMRVTSQDKDSQSHLGRLGARSPWFTSSLIRHRSVVARCLRERSHHLWSPNQLCTITRAQPASTFLLLACQNGLALEVPYPGRTRGTCFGLANPRRTHIDAHAKPHLRSSAGLLQALTLLLQTGSGLKNKDDLTSGSRLSTTALGETVNSPL